MYESDDKMVSHPSHYQSKSGLEVIDVIEAFTEGLTGIEATDTGNILKYICRWKNKNGIQDLKKAQWYLTHLIETIKKRNVESFEVTFSVSGKKKVFQYDETGKIVEVDNKGENDNETEIGK